MNGKLSNLLQNSVAVPNGLSARVAARVEKAARRQALWRLISGSVASAAFLGLLVLAGREIAVQAAASGFGQYLSLFLSGGTAVLASWRELGLVMIESAPVTGLALSLGALGFLVMAMRSTARYWSGFRAHTGVAVV